MPRERRRGRAAEDAPPRTRRRGRAAEDALAILHAHVFLDFKATYPEPGRLPQFRSICSCGEVLTGTRNEVLAAQPAHVAQVLAEWVTGEKARAWNEGATAIRNSDPLWWAVIVRENPYEKDQEADRG